MKLRHGRILTGLLVACILAFAFPFAQIATAANQTFDDGQEHTVNSTLSFVYVRNPSPTPPTTLHVISPANISFLEIHDSSSADISTGTISFANAHDTSTFSMTGGTL